MKKKTSTDVEATISSLRELVHDAEELLASAGNEADEATKKLRARLQSALDETQEFYSRARESAREQIDECDEYVRTHPYHAIGVAAAVGAIVGLMVTRRS